MLEQKKNNVEDIGDSKTKYKATERTKDIIKKHAKEAAEFFLKINNTKVDGLDKDTNGFIMLYKTGKKVFMVSEGDMGKIMVENINYRNEMFENAKKIETILKTPILTSMLKGKYGKRDERNTPKGHKRQNYKGIGAENKSKKSNARKNILEISSDEDNIENSKNKTKKSLLKKNKAKTPEESSDTNSASENGDNERSAWLSEMVMEEIENRRPTNSKKPIKQAKQMFPFKCSECNAKYKTKVRFEAHLREMHGF